MMGKSTRALWLTIRRTRVYSGNMRHPGRAKAKALFRRAMRDGRLVRPTTCERCGKGGLIQGHHDDYNKPLDVRWLCASCHAYEHGFGKGNAGTHPPRQVQIEILKRVNIKGRARFMDNTAARNLRNAFVRKVTAETTLRQYGMITEQPIFLLQLLELPATLDAFDPAAVSPEIIEALDDVSASIDQLRARYTPGALTPTPTPSNNELLAQLLAEIQTLRSELATVTAPREAA
jgi:ribosomal protein S27AE